MSIERIIVSIIAALFQSLAATIIIFKQITSKNLKTKSIFFILLSVYAVIGFLFVNNQFRFILFIVVISLLLYFLVGVKTKTVVLYAFNTEVLFVISEISSTLLLVLFGFDSVDIVNNNYYNLLANILISVFSVFLINFKIIKRLLHSIINLFNKNKKLINYLYIFLLILYLIVSKNGLELILKSNYYINILFVFGVVLVITIFIKSELKYDQKNEENKQMLNYVTKYEKIITEQGKANHEFKNQLMVIRGYAQMNKPDKLIEYLDSVVDDTKKTNSSYLISQLNKFPDGGIKGLLYYKLSIMDDDKIKYEINVESGVKTKLNYVTPIMYKNITKILGVILDNAIDASKKCNDKRIIIDVTKENSKVIFSISNTYKGKIDMTKIGTGYTSKGSGHGYGLKLVKDIIEENKSLNIQSLIKEDYYTSKLIIKTRVKKKK